MKFPELHHLGVCAAVLLLGSLALANPPQGGYHLLKKYELGAPPGGKEYWDYITFDASTRRLYISHNTEVKVVDADSGTIIGDIPDLKRVHGIALVPDLGRGFISDGGADEAVVFDVKTLKVTGHIKTGGNPDCILYEPTSKHIFTMNGKSNDATVIDPVTETVVATIPMGGRPEYAVADGKGMIYDNIEDRDEVVALDSHTNTVKAHWPIAPSGGATAMEMDVQHRRLFIGGRNKVLAIMDADTGKVLQTFPIGDGVDTNIYEPETALLFTATREGTLHIFHEDTPDKFSLVETIKTEFGARNMALDSKTHKLFIDTADFAPAAAPTTEQPKPQPTPVSGTFRLSVYGR
ncbi:MAG: YVTN family beta-propeller domain-containing protein [Acidobacteria bacterium]|nr:MAG: YVTN family beta-propeller domain-containing protein [Acidobacteriota bacterium]